MSNIFRNHIFIYYRNNHKSQILILLYQNENNTIFLKNSKSKLTKIFIF